MWCKVLASLAILGCVWVVGCEGGVISNSLFSSVQANGAQDAILELPSVASKVLSNPALKGASGSNKTNILVALLQQSTTASQAPFLSQLSLLGVQSTPFWIANKVAIKDASPEVLSVLSMMPGTFTLREPNKVKLNPVHVRPARDNGEVQWGVEKIGAPTVWASKTRGEGIVIANIDTGVNGEHEALQSNYRGGEGSSSWYDPIGNQESPYDDLGHGTHTMGTICGTTRGIGVAPGATWIACKAFSSEGGSEESLTACAQWVLRPNDNADLRPNVVSNSWGGGQGRGFFDDEIRMWREAGIIPIFSIGNSGRKGCNTANSPGDRDGIISVGSTKSDDSMSDFSSRGKSVDGKMKPEVSGPGSDVISAGHRNSNAYVSMSGTSMACPHVAGATALLLAGGVATNFDDVINALESTAVQPAVTRADLRCGTKNRRNYPNNAYGHGRIDVRKAFGL